MLLEIHPDNPEQRKIERVVAVLKKGGVVIIPTDTIYALACDMYQYKAFEKIAQIKGVKPSKANFSLLCADLSNISQFTRPFDRSIFKLLNRALPGPYTFILESGSEVPSVFRSNKKTIGLRVPDNNIVLELIRILGNPLIATSLHNSDIITEYPTDPYEIDSAFGNITDLIIDGGFGHNTPSTIIDCTGQDPVVIREGAGDISILH